MRSKVGLIAYADRFGGDLAGLRALLGGPLRGLFGGVHVLPFYRPYDGADAGFDPQDHTQVDPRLGSWADIAALSAEYQLMADVIVNHVSSSCAQFQDWLAHGRASQFAGMFLTFGTVFPDGAAEDTLTRLYRPRPGLPFSPYVLADGSKALVWTTFTPQQIDIDVRHPATRAYLLHVLDKLAGCWTPFAVSMAGAVASLTVSAGFSRGSGCGRLVCDDTLSMSEWGRPSPCPFAEARGGP
jgi:sucrose phosphorylase